MRLKNILTGFDAFADNDDKENINEDIVFEMELIRQVEINIDYILMLVAKYHDSNCEDKSILVDIKNAVDSSIQLRSKKELIDNSFRDGTLKTIGTDIDKIMPPVSRFSGGGRAAKKQGIIEKLLKFFEKYFGLI